MQKGRRKVAQRQTKSSLVISGVVITAVVIAFTLGVWVGTSNDRRAVTGSSVSVCRTSALMLTATGDVGAGNASYTIVFHNASPQPCSMQGYPDVIAWIESKPLVVAPGARPWPQLVEIAQSTQAGGVIGSNGQLEHYRPPVVLLRARTGVASTTIDWGEEQPNPETKCWTAKRFIVTPPGDFSALTLDRGGLLCSRVFVTPIVPGSSGLLRLK